MSPNGEHTYTVYVLFRGRRLALKKRIHGLEAARAAMVAFRKERFHDPEQVVLVDDTTNEIVGADAKCEPASEPPPEDRPTASSAPPPRVAEPTAPPDRSSLLRLQQAMEATRAALERHTSAVATVARLRSRVAIEPDALSRLETSARAMSSLIHRSLEQLDQVITMLEHRGQPPPDEPPEPPRAMGAS